MIKQSGILKWSLEVKMNNSFSEYGFAYDKLTNVWIKNNLTIYKGAGISEETSKPITILSLVSNYRTKDEKLLSRGKENIIEYLNKLKRKIRTKNLKRLLNE